MKHYIDTDYYWQELSNIANDVLAEMYDIFAERDDKEIDLDDALIRNCSVNVVKIKMENDSVFDEELFAYTDEGDVFMVRELSTSDIIALAEELNECLG